MTQEPTLFGIMWQALYEVGQEMTPERARATLSQLNELMPLMLAGIRQGMPIKDEPYVEPLARVALVGLLTEVARGCRVTPAGIVDPGPSLN